MFWVSVCQCCLPGLATSLRVSDEGVSHHLLLENVFIRRVWVILSAEKQKSGLPLEETACHFFAWSTAVSLHASNPPGPELFLATSLLASR